MDVLFIGSPVVKASIAKQLAPDAIVKTTPPADICLCEISTGADVAKIPKNLEMPVFLYVSAKNKSIPEEIRKLSISGIMNEPFDRGAFLRKAEQVLNAGRLPSSAEDYEKLKVRILAKAESIPQLPAFVSKLISMTSENSESSMPEIIELIKKDQGIAAKIMRMVNSPFFMLRQEITSIDRAAVLLGFQSMKNIALAASISQYYAKNFAVYKMTGPELWRHAYITALLCEELARLKGLDTSSMYLSGLLHDIGKMLCVDFLVKEVQSIDDERAQLGMDHAEIGWLIAGRWQLAKEIQDAIRAHHSPGREIHAVILYYANIYANSVSSSDEEAVEECLNGMGAALSLDKRVLAGIMSGIVKNASEVPA